MGEIGQALKNGVDFIIRQENKWKLCWLVS